MAKKRVLCVGLVCLDEINVVSSYPIEDTDQRSVDRYTARGGNASNSSTVLASIGEAVECFATLGANKEKNSTIAAMPACNLRAKLKDVTLISSGWQVEANMNTQRNLLYGSTVFSFKN